jgi:hypothetical protein
MPRNIILKRIFYSLLAGFAIAILINEFSYLMLKTNQDRAPQEIVLVIPAGTAARVAQGESDPSIPSDLTFVVGDTLTVENRDSVSHRLGPFFIPSGSSATIHLDEVANLQYACSFKPQNYLGLDVFPPLTFATRLAGIVLSALPMAVLFALYGLIAIPYKKPAEKSA